MDDLYRLVLQKGLITQDINNKETKYNIVKLRCTDIGHERKATRMAEQCRMLNGAPVLVVSESDYQNAMILMHIEQFECPGLKPITEHMLDFDSIAKVHPIEWQIISERVVLINLYERHKYGLISNEDYQQALRAGGMIKDEANDTAPKSEGSADGIGEAAVESQSGPIMLADNLRDHTHSPA